MKRSEAKFRPVPGEKSRAHAEGGFTLIEVMLAIGLLAIVLSALYSSFFLARRAADTAGESMEKLQECRMALDAIGRELETLKQDDKYRFKVEDRDFYGKDAARMTFAGFSPVVPGLAVISYSTDEKDGVRSVFKKVRSVTDTRDPEPVDVLEGIDSFTVEVLSKGKWIKTWDSENNPEEIRVTVRMKAKDRTLSFTQTVSPKIGRAL